MATIDLIVLGILKKEPMSAYDIQKLVEYRNISKWVKISTPSIYKKTIQLEQKGLIKGSIVKEGKMPEKVIYSLTEAGEKAFEKLMFDISSEPIHIFLDFNAVIVNLDSLPLEKKKMCIDSIQEKNKGAEKLFGTEYKGKGKYAGDSCNRYGCFTAAVCFGRSNRNVD